jgi:hypothetical protein
VAPTMQRATHKVVDDSWGFPSPSQSRDRQSIRCVQLFEDVFGQICLATTRWSANQQGLLTLVAAQERFDVRLIVGPAARPWSRCAVEKEAVCFIRG